jgi:nicotinic acid mononucleotide adenylyltransferase
MSLKQIVNESLKKRNNTIGFLFGRFNPPTKGHMENISRMVEWCKKHEADSLIVPTKTQDHSNNPLSFGEKKKFLSKCTNVEIDAWNSGGIFSLLDKFESLGYEHVVLFVGEDRVDEFRALFKKYVMQPNYHFTIEVIGTGSRQTGVSGTQQRQYAIDDNKTEFLKNCPQNLPANEALKMFELIKSRLKSASK